MPESPASGSRSNSRTALATEVDRWTVRGEAKSARFVDASLGLDQVLALRDASAVLMVDAAQASGHPHMAGPARGDGAGAMDPSSRPCRRAAAHVAGVALVAARTIEPTEHRSRRTRRNAWAGRLSPAIAVVDDETLRARLYPWFEPQHGDRPMPRPAGLPRRALRCAHRWTRSASATWSCSCGGTDDRTSTRAAMLCGPRCFGFSWGTRSSSSTAIVLDARKARPGRRSPSAAQRQRLHAGLHPPRFRSSRATESKACDELAASAGRRSTARHRSSTVPAPAGGPRLATIRP